MANGWHVEWLKEGVVRWNKRRKRVDFVPDLSDIRFFNHLPKDFRDDPKTSRYFEKIDLSGANLRNSDLSDLNFYSANFTGADLTAANLSRSNFDRAKFVRASLDNVDATRASMKETLFEESALKEMEFSGSEVRGAIFIRTELSAIQLQEIGDQRVKVFPSRMSFQQSDILSSGPLLNESGVVRSGASKSGLVDNRIKKNSYDVYYATNRLPIYERESITGFGATRNTNLSFGLCEVIVPEGHRIGAIGSPLYRKLFNKKDDSLRIGGIIPLDRDLFWTHLLRTSDRMKDKARPTVFIHGFNNSFKAAVLRAAQIGYDLGIGQGIGLFSWPSKGGIAGLTCYSADEASAEASKYSLAEFLEDFVKHGTKLGINIVALSMGCRVLLGAFEVLAARHSSALDEINQVILAAADVDVGVMPHLGKHVIQHSERLTSYVSGLDKALKLSGWLHSFPRVGKTPPTYVLEGMDTVIVNSMDLGDFSHGYIASSRVILGDIYGLLKNNLPPEDRHSLEPISASKPTVWRIKE